MRTETTAPSMTAPKNVQQRRPRAHWVGVLEKLVAPLNADPAKVYDWKRWDNYFRHEDHGRFEVNALYVFGSFARGAADSSDLDLIVVVTPLAVYHDGFKEDRVHLPNEIYLKKAIWGAPRHVEVFGEDVGSDHRRKQFPEHRLVWSQEQPDLHQNLAAISLVEGAGRFERKSDRLPLSIKLFDARIPIGPDAKRPDEEIVDAIDRGELVSTFIPLESIDVSPALTEEQTNAFWQLRDSKRPSVLPTMRYLLSSTEAPYLEGPHRLSHPDTSILLNGCLVMFRRPLLSAAPLERANITRILLVPDVPKTVTPGIWQLERGPEHAVVKAFEEVELYFLADGDGPARVWRRDHDWWHDDDVAIHGFGTRAEAEKEAAKWKKDRRLELNVVSVRGVALLEWFTRVSAVYVNGVEIETGQKATAFLEGVRSAVAGACRYSMPRKRDHQAISRTNAKGVYNLEGGGFLALGHTRNLATDRIIEIVLVLPDAKLAPDAGRALRQGLRQAEFRQWHDG